MSGKLTYEELEDRVRFLEKEIVELRESKDVLRESEEKYRTILESIEDGYYEVDTAGNFTFFNDSMCRILGYSRSELLSMNNRKYMDRENAEKVFKAFNRVYMTGRPDSGFEWELFKKNGSKTFVEASVSLMRDKKKRKIGFQGIVRNISERKKIEEELRRHRDHLEELVGERTSELIKTNERLKREIEGRKQVEKALRKGEKEYKKLYETSKKAEEVYRSLLHSSADPIAIYDMKGLTQYVSRAFTDIFGWTIEEVKGMRMPFIPQPEKEKTMAIIKDIVENGRSYHGFETKRLTKDGRLLDVSISASRYDDHDGVPAGILVVLRDITDRKRLHTQLRHAQKMESIGTIASGVAHNFRNILAGISVNSQFMQIKFKEQPDLMEIAERVNSYVKRGAKLVEGLLQFSRKQSGEREFKTFNLTDVIKETCDLINRSFDKMIDISMDLTETLPVLGDDSSLRQVLMNICTNARDAMPDGGMLKIKALQKGKRAEVIISDTGSGMDEETQKKCFDPFFTTKDVDRGTGLGLSTSYGIVKDHRGDVHISSEIDKGTTFRLSFPLAFPENESSEEETQEIIKGDGMKILVVDDEDEMLNTMIDILESLGYSAIRAGKGKEAIDRYGSWRPDAVLMDRNMAGMDGIRCTEKIIEQDPDARVILVSGYDEDGPQGIDSRTRGMISGYLTKPIEIEELSSLLARLFKKKGR